jgi:hypothetical protein
MKTFACLSFLTLSLTFAAASAFAFGGGSSIGPVIPNQGLENCGKLGGKIKLVQNNVGVSLNQCVVRKAVLREKMEDFQLISPDESADAACDYWHEEGYITQVGSSECQISPFSLAREL